MIWILINMHPHCLVATDSVFSSQSALVNEHCCSRFFNNYCIMLGRLLIMASVDISLLCIRDSFLVLGGEGGGEHTIIHFLLHNTSQES